MKVCRICGELKPLDAFYRRPAHRDGRETRCIDCEKARARRWQRDNPEKANAKSARWKAKTAYNRTYYETNRAALLEYKRQPEVRARRPELDRRYYEKNREAHQAYTRDWRRANPERHASYDYTRRSAAVAMRPEDIDYLTILRDDPCAYCGARGGHVDHIEPLSSGGDSGWDNLTAACRSCNSRKRATGLLAFLARRA